jgi:glycine/D-amino acid oxidase-like deaminating enzyme
MNQNPPDEVNVLVVGFGAAGAAAAISAHDAGASVAIVEKTASGGGNCVHSGGFLFDLGGPRAVDHLDALCFGKTDRTVLEAYAAGLREVPEFIEALG